MSENRRIVIRLDDDQFIKVENLKLKYGISTSAGIVRMLIDKIDEIEKFEPYEYRMQQLENIVKSNYKATKCLVTMIDNGTSMVPEDFNPEFGEYTKKVIKHHEG